MSDPLVNNFLAVIKVVGVGGAGGNAVNQMIEKRLRGVEFIAINTDGQDLLKSEAHVKLEIGGSSTRSLGAGADPEVGRRAAEDHVDEIAEVLRGSDMVFVAAGEGGGTGTGAAPVVARIAKQAGALTVGVVSRPFDFEGKRRAENAQAGIDALRAEVDTLIIVPNQRLIELNDEELSFTDAFSMADDVLRAGVQGISDLITEPGLVNLDFADVKSVMQGAGTALMGIGTAKGEDRAMRAAEQAINHPLLENSIDNARGVLIQFAAASNMKLKEVNDAARLIQEVVHPSANIIFGTSIDNALGDEIRVTVIGAGFDEAGPRPVQRATGFSAPVSGAIPVIAEAEAILETAEAPLWYAGNTGLIPVAVEEEEEVFVQVQQVVEEQKPWEQKTNASRFDDGYDIPDFLQQEMTQLTLAERLNEVHARIDQAAQEANRQSDEIQLVIVSKNHPADLVLELLALGETNFGENKDQEASAKAEQVKLSNQSGLEPTWHFVGQLQSNKVKSMLAYSKVLHSLDRPSLLNELVKQLAKAPESQLDVFIELNLTGDPGRGGILPEALLSFAETVLEAKQLNLLGVMGVAGLEGTAASYFETIAKSSEELRTIAPQAKFISAGMSGDYEEAIRHGATHLRIGTAITGNRQFPP